MVYVVPHETVDSQVQGGMNRLPIESMIHNSVHRLGEPQAP